MAHFTLLDQASEDKLHSTRLLNIEERPFKRITKRLLAPSTPIASYLTRAPTNPRPRLSQNASPNPDAPSSEPDTPPPTTINPDLEAKYLKDLQRFREDLIIDFASFDSSIARVQFLYLANAKQRQRYTEEKISIQTTSDQVREDMDRLKIRLDEAQNLLQVRKGYDVLAEKITRNKDLKARDEQQVNIERLRAEIEELEREGVELGNAWVERRDQFGKVVEEGARLRRVVRGEPEPDAKGDGEGDAEGDGEGEDEDDENKQDRRSDVDGEGDGDRDENMLGFDEGQRGHSNMGTPLIRPSGEHDGEDAPTPLPGIHESGALTPRSLLGDAEVSTPRIEVTGTGEGGEDQEMKDGNPLDGEPERMDTT